MCLSIYNYECWRVSSPLPPFLINWSVSDGLPTLQLPFVFLFLTTFHYPSWLAQVENNSFSFFFLSLVGKFKLNRLRWISPFNREAFPANIFHLNLSKECQTSNIFIYNHKYLKQLNLGLFLLKIWNCKNWSSSWWSQLYLNGCLQPQLPILPNIRRYQ